MKNYLLCLTLAIAVLATGFVAQTHPPIPPKSKVA